MDLNKDLSIRIDRLVDREGSHVKAYASVTIGGVFAVHGIRVMDSEKGLFVQMPQRTIKRGDSDPEYTDLFHPVTADARKAISDKVLGAFAEKVKEQAAEKAAAPDKGAAAPAAPTPKPHKPAPER